MNTTLRSAAWVQALRTAWQQRPARARLWVMACGPHGWLLKCGDNSIGAGVKFEHT